MRYLKYLVVLSILTGFSPVTAMSTTPSASEEATSNGWEKLGSVRAENKFGTTVHLYGTLYVKVIGNRLMYKFVTKDGKELPVNRAKTGSKTNAYIEYNDGRSIADYYFDVPEW